MDRQTFGSNNVRVLGVVKDGQTSYIVFEHPNAGSPGTAIEPGDSTGSSSNAPITTLCDYMESRKSVLPQGQIMMIAFKVLSGLKVYSEMHFAHNGIHLDNIFLSKSAGFVLGPPDIYPARNSYEMEGNTMHLVSPELKEGKHPSLMTDVWTFGSLCLQLVHYRYPTMESTDLMMSDHDFGSKHDRASVCEVTDITLIDVAQSCINNEPANRPTCSQAYYSPVQKMLTLDIFRAERSRNS